MKGDREINGRGRKEKEKCVTLYACQAFREKGVKAIALTLKNRGRDLWLEKREGIVAERLSVLLNVPPVVEKGRATFQRRDPLPFCR